MSDRIATAGRAGRLSIFFRYFAVASFLVTSACDAGSTAGPPAVASSITPVVSTNLSAEVGRPLPAEPRIVVKDGRGRPVAGVRIVFRVTDGDGAIERDFAITDDDGRAGPGEWTLGTKPGRQAIDATASGVGGVQIVATALPGPAAALSVVAGSGQSAPPNTALSTSPAFRVTDEFGNAAPGAVVQFAVVEGGGAVQGATGTAGADGVVYAGTWVLGPVEGRNVLRAVAGSAAADVEALAVEANANRLVVHSGTDQVAEAGTAVPVAPAVLAIDPEGNPVAGVSVRFAVGTGKGLVAAGAADDAVSVLTGEDGIARLDEWLLGTTAGTQILVASAGPSATVTFVATAIPGAPAAIMTIAGDAQRVAAGQFLPIQPAVRVADRYGNPVPGAVVSFKVTSGGGLVTPGTAETDAAGVARAVWQLGSTPGQNELSAWTGGLSTSFTATATTTKAPVGGFAVKLRYVSSLTGPQKAVVESAAARWSAVITGDLPDVPVKVAAGACAPAINEVIDDILVFVETAAIDGPGSTLASAGPCYVRSASGLPVVGRITVDVADLGFMEDGGTLGDVILHELGHVLGIGVDWIDRLVGDGGPDPYFTGTTAVAEYAALGGVGPGVPVEATGGSGTAYAHWRETVFGTEVMTGWINYGAANPLSRVTAGLLRDLGYAVDMSRTDAYDLSAGGIAGNAAAIGGQRFELVERRLPEPVRIGPDGRPIG